jgi:hypothetical protein
MSHHQRSQYDVTQDPKRHRRAAEKKMGEVVISLNHRLNRQWIKKKKKKRSSSLMKSKQLTGDKR